MIKWIDLNEFNRALTGNSEPLPTENNKHNALWDAQVIKEIYNKLKITMKEETLEKANSLKSEIKILQEDIGTLKSILNSDTDSIAFTHSPNIINSGGTYVRGFYHRDKALVNVVANAILEKQKRELYEKERQLELL